MTNYIAIGLAVLALIVACFSLFEDRYQIAASPAAHFVYRVDVRTGLITYYALGNNKEFVEMGHMSK